MGGKCDISKTSLSQSFLRGRRGRMNGGDLTATTRFRRVGCRANRNFAFSRGASRLCRRAPFAHRRGARNQHVYNRAGESFTTSEAL